MSQTGDTEKFKPVEVSRDAPEAAGRFIKGFIRPEPLKDKALADEIQAYFDGKLSYAQLSEAARTIEGRASTISLDLDREIILPSAAEPTLALFTGGHSPFLGNHGWGGEDGSPAQIGWVKQVALKLLDIVCAFLFGLTEAAEQWFRLARDPKGKGIAFSIGFIPRARVTGTAAQMVEAFPQIAGAIQAAGLAPGEIITVYTEIELLEISAVGVPANRQATQILAAAAGGKLAAGLEQKVTELSQVIGRLEEQLSAFRDRYDRLDGRLTELFDQIIGASPDYVHPRPQQRSCEQTGPDVSAEAPREAARTLMEAAGRLMAAAAV